MKIRIIDYGQSGPTEIRIKNLSAQRSSLLPKRTDKPEPLQRTPIRVAAPVIPFRQEKRDE